MSSADFMRLADAAAERYRPAGRFAHGFARGKLRNDPAFEHLLAAGLLSQATRVLDLGCGQGLLAALLAEARIAADAGRWPPGWPPPPRARVHGIELMPRDVERARQALGDEAEIEEGDIVTTRFTAADAVVILDVLHYIGYEQQVDVLRRVRAALAPSGRLLLRVGDAGGGTGFRASQAVDRIVTFVRGHRLSRLYCRALGEWVEVVRDAGFRVESRPMSRGTPFANVLLVADCAAPNP